MNYVGREAKARPKLFINFTITITKGLLILKVRDRVNMFE